MRQNPTVYKIDNDFNFIEVITKVTSQLQANTISFISRDLEVSKYPAKLIIIESEEKDSEWSSFFPKKYINGISLNYQIPSLLLLIQAPQYIFAIVGGGFYKHILPFLDMSYGLNAYSRIMDPINDQIISIKTRGVTGLRAGMKEQFKDNYRIIDYIKFGKIPVELKIRLSTEKSELLFRQFLTLRSPHIILNISSGFTLNKKLTFLELGDLIETLISLQNLKANDFFSSYKEITNKETISNNLKPALINELFNKRSDIINNKTSNFEVCYPNKIEEFYSADEYLVKLKTDKHKFVTIGNTIYKSDILRIILNFLSQKNYDRNLETFKHKIYNIYITTVTHSSKKTTLRTALIYHLNTELYIKSMGTFIYLDSKWYKLREIFITEMNNRCSEILKANNLNNTVLSEKWSKRADGKRVNEDIYNNQYNKNDYWVLDKIIIDSVELADVIFVKDGTLFICHIKYGFSTELRELYSQIITSARRLKNDLKNDSHEFLKKNYSQLQRENKHNGIGESEFIDLFTKYNIKYVMSFTGHLRNRDLLTQVEKYTSNIAKLSLIQCFTDMRNDYYDLSIEVIKEDNTI